ncbi:Transcription factor [Macleaya cordata]|uniref:Transcription factor n=1 Tax=Macleaya cordata TaxID=56857 RepID=A0A200QMS5_MACCD|nr:Transcription factor [Macleaya cordata]
MEKKTQGRKKIDMEKIKRRDYLQVTFSKRRNGLFKKASELCTMCGAKTAIVVYSPAGKAFSFGHPCVESTLDKFLATASLIEIGESSLGVPSFPDYHWNIGINKLNRHINELVNQLEAEKKYREGQFLWNKPIENLKFHELEQLRVSMEELKIKMVNRTEGLKRASMLSSYIDINQVRRTEDKGVQ